MTETFNRYGTEGMFAREDELMAKARLTDEEIESEFGKDVWEQSTATTADWIAELQQQKDLSTFRKICYVCKGTILTPHLLTGIHDCYRLNE